jgi:hypothetical protein
MHMFCILVCRTCFNSFDGHVALVYILLHFNYPETKKNLKIDNQNLNTKFKEPML